MNDDKELPAYRRDFDQVTSTLLRSRALHAVAARSGRAPIAVASEAAHGLLDVREAAARLTDLIPELLSQELTAEELPELLDQLAEELRHLYYHINDMELFEHVRTQ